MFERSGYSLSATQSSTLKSGTVRQVIKAGDWVSGTSLGLSAMVTGKNVPSGAKIKLQVITTAGKTVYEAPLPSGTFATMPLSHTPVVTGAQGKKLKVIVVYPAGAGKVYVEEVSLMADAP